MDNELSVGSRLRVLRLERDLSQRELARLSGVSTNAVSLIERDEISPSVATLQRLAGALGVRMSYFFDSLQQARVLHVTTGARPRIASGGVVIEGIGARLHEHQLEPFYLTLEPGSAAGNNGPVVHAGQEFVCCLKGCVQYEIDGEPYLLSPGDFLLFEADLPHFWRNPGEELAEFLLVLHAPDQAGDPVSRHFAKYPSLAHIG